MSVAVKSLPEILDQLQRDLALDDEELAAILGIPQAALEQTRATLRPLPAAVAQRLDQLIAFKERLQDSFEPEGVTLWLRSGSRYLHGMTTLAALKDGRFDRANIALDALDAGIFL